MCDNLTISGTRAMANHDNGDSVAMSLEDSTAVPRPVPSALLQYLSSCRSKISRRPSQCTDEWNAKITAEGEACAFLYHPLGDDSSARTLFPQESAAPCKPRHRDAPSPMVCKTSKNLVDSEIIHKGVEERVDLKEKHAGDCIRESSTEVHGIRWQQGKDSEQREIMMQYQPAAYRTRGRILLWNPLYYEVHDDIDMKTDDVQCVAPPFDSSSPSKRFKSLTYQGLPHLNTSNTSCAEFNTWWDLEKSMQETNQTMVQLHCPSRDVEAAIHKLQSRIQEAKEILRLGLPDKQQLERKQYRNSDC